MNSSVKTPLPVYIPENSHPAVSLAAQRLIDAGLCTGRTPRFEDAKWVCSTSGSLQRPAVPPRTFSLFDEGGKHWIIADRPRTLLAGTLYSIRQHQLGKPLPIPLTKTSPYRERLILEDFPFHCYQPNGFDFDARCYAENLVALGYTAMECNRFSKKEPLGRYFDTYLFTNPSPAPFVWTPWHKDVWNREIVEANAAELRACVLLASEFDLDPSITSFLPRPYPEAFFQRHPHLRGPSFRHAHMVRGDHPPVHRINTDNPEGIAFYRDVYSRLLEANPEIRHLFFWHGDIGTQFWPDGEGPLARTEADRIAEFHQMIDSVLEEKSLPAKVWINPWAMPQTGLEQLNRTLPRRVGYAVKDNTGACWGDQGDSRGEEDSAYYCGTTCSTLSDLTIISPSIGALPRYIRALAKQSQRTVCLCQYQDFSEDLDPIFGVPHPLLTFRKFQSLARFAPDASSTNWGVISPELTESRINQDVIREMTWGSPAHCFTDLLPLLLPVGLSSEAKEAVVSAWYEIDIALQVWPQFWGLRLQDGGLRYRWLVKPLRHPSQTLSENNKEYYLGAQTYRVDSATPFTDFLDLNTGQAREIATLYTEMSGLLQRAETQLETALASTSETTFIHKWIASQITPTRLLRFFFLTYRNLFSFHALPVGNAPGQGHRRWLQAEIDNTRQTLSLFQSHPRCLISVSRENWGQCFGPRFQDDFKKKLALMEALLGGFPAPEPEPDRTSAEKQSCSASR